MFHQARISAIVSLGVILSAAALRADGPCSTVYVPNPVPEHSDWFGYAVAVSGDVAVVGAHQDNSGGFGDAGSVYVYRLEGSAWLLEQAIPNPASVGPSGDHFGFSVAVSGDVALVGARSANVSGLLAGSAYVYRYNGSAWLLEQAIPNPQPAQSDYFGYAVAVSGDVAVVGAPGDATGGVLSAGSAYVYRYNGSAWLLDLAIPNPEPASQDLFGWSVAVSGDVAVVGARGDDPGGVSEAGSVYVYRYDGSAWLLDLAIANPQPEYQDLFGYSVAVSGDVMVVGAYFDDYGDYADVGSIHVYRYSPGAPGWLLEQAIPNPQSDLTGANDYFGYSVSVSGNVAVVGAYGDDPGFVNHTGSAYVYQYNGSAWVQDQAIPNPDPAAEDYFGRSVAVSGGVAVVGAYFDDPDGVLNAGSAYIFSLTNAADLDGDCDADLDDYAFVYSCFAGPNIPVDAACLGADLSGDGDVDLEDLALFQDAFAAAP